VTVDGLPRVTCVLLNWNGWRDTIECLDALRECTYPRLDVIVVDNGSTNDSVAHIRAAHPDTQLLESRRNLGFAGGNNIGIRFALENGSDYVWLLNNDTQPAPEALCALVSKAGNDLRMGAVGSISYYFGEPDIVQIWAGGRVNLWIGYAPSSTKPHEDAWFDWLNGTSLLLSRAALEDVGLLDESYFLYWDDVEMGLRLRNHGWKLGAAPDSRILHKVSASTRGNKILLDRYATASGLRTLKLYSPAPRIAMCLFVAIRFARRLLRFEFSRCKSVWRGIQDYWESVRTGVDACKTPAGKAGPSLRAG